MKLGGIATLLAAAVVLAGCAAPEASPDDAVMASRASQFAVDTKASMEAKVKEAAEARKLAVTFPSDRPLRVLLAGDSLLVGAFASKEELGYGPQILSDLAKRGAVESTVVKKGGGTAAVVSGMIPEPVPAADLVIVELSTNDFNNVPKTDVQEFTKTYRDLLARVRATSPDAALFCLGSWAPGSSGTDLYDFPMDKACSDNHGRYLDLSELYGAPGNRGPAGVRAVGGISDIGHPNDVGHRKIADLVMAHIK